jgi:hypothetical protein
MKLIDRTSTADKLQAARNNLSNAEELIAALGEVRTRALKEGDEVEAARADAEIANEHGHVARLKDQIVLLEELAAGDAHKRRCVEYDNALAIVQSKWLPGLKAKLSDVEKAMTALTVAIESVVDLQHSKLNECPEQLPRPLKSQMSSDLIERTLALAFGVFDKKHARWNWTLDEKLEHVRAKAALLVGTQAKLYDEMNSDLKLKAPKPAETEKAA